MHNLLIIYNKIENTQPRRTDKPSREGMIFSGTVNCHGPEGSWFLVRIMPCRTREEVSGGVVITLANITAAKTLETQLREENAKLNRLLEAGG